MLLADGFEEAEALVPLDILRRGGARIKTVGITGKTVTGSHGITVEADLLPSEANETPTLLILPGGMPGTTNLDASPETERLLEKTLASGGRVGAICAAPFILGRLGLLEGKRRPAIPALKQS
jgi:4-methyl-5(b-hydroxyethyl)-thiazole monophosphate biosynthesis